jgi:Mg-chelatase subunit ChlI
MNPARDFFRSEFAERLASSSAASSVDGDAHEKRERMSRYAAALASASGGVQRGNPLKGVRIRTELLPPTRPVSARRAASPPRKNQQPSAGRASVLTPSTRDGTRATPAMIKARYEASKLEEERAFEEQMKTLRRLEREANARAAAAAEAAEAAAFLASSPGPGPQKSFPSLDDTAGSLGDLDLLPGRVPTGIGRSPSQSPSTRRPAARASPKDKAEVLPLWDGFS